MDGYIHSIESFGTVDGPGIRFVIFMQGCPMRCKYCHNPDTWKTGCGEKISADEIMARFNKNKVFYKNGGITVTGGEPLLQIDFLLELFKKAKDAGIHTVIDTSGVTYSNAESEYNKKLDALLSLTDLVMLDIKHIEREEHIKLTERDNENILHFAMHLGERNIPTLIRHVLVPGITDSPEALASLGKFVAGIKSVKAIDVIPYHTLGVKKYETLGIPYALSGVPDATAEDVRRAKEIVITSFKKARNEKKQG